jgi:hypothetical protein
LSLRWPGRILAFGVTAASAAVMAVYAAAGFTAYVARPLVVGRAQLFRLIPDEPQASNQTTKSDREALLLGSPSYTNFNPAFLALAFSVTTADRKSDVTFLNDGQIAGIEKRLRLSQRQAEHWPAVAAALRDIGRRYFQRRNQHQNAALKVDVNSPEVQRLIETATPLILQLSEDQKREVRQLVRIIGLQTIASQI